MANYLKATVVIPPRNTESEDEAIVSVLPILPDLILETPDGDIYFDTERATYTYNQEQPARINRYFQALRSEEHTSELQSLMRLSYAVCCLNKNKHKSANLTHGTRKASNT